MIECNVSVMALTVIETDRLLLRPWRRDDTEALHSLWTEPDVRRYLWDDVVIPFDTAEQLVEDHLLAQEQWKLGYWAIFRAGDSQLAGFCGFRRIEEGPEIELLYGLRSEHWGKGLATEASRAALGYLWQATSYQRVYARTDPPNSRSVEVMKRLGMRHDSTTATRIVYVLARPNGEPGSGTT